MNKISNKLLLTVLILGGTPTKANVINRLTLLEAEVNPAYENGAAYFLSPQIYSVFVEALATNGGNLEWDSTQRLRMWNGTPVIRTSYIPKPAAASKAVAFYGNLFAAATLLMRQEVRVDEYSETHPGSYLYFAEQRFLHVLKDTSAVAGMITGT